MDRDLEKQVIQYLAELPSEARPDAFSRINAGLKLQVPPDEATPPPPIMTLGKYVDQELESPPYLLNHGQLVRAEITVTIGRAGKGKTTLVTNRMIKWGAGLPLFPGTTSQTPLFPLRILLIENEGAAWHMQDTFKRLLAAAKMDEEHLALARENVMVWGDGGYSGLKIDKPEDYNQIERACELHKPDVVIMEPFRGIWRGEENDATAMEEVLDAMVRLGKTYDCGILLSHHERKGGVGEDGDWMSAARGSGDLEGKVAVMENFREVKAGKYRELKWSKSRYDQKQPGIRLEYDNDTRSYKLVPNSAVEDEVLRVLTEEEGFMSKSQLREETEETDTALGPALTELISKDLIIKKNREGGVQYRLKLSDTDKGEGLDC